MFFTCFIIGAVVLHDLPLFEYMCFCGAFTASIVELGEPFGLNDNLTIPVCSGMVMYLSAQRIGVYHLLTPA